MVKRGVLARGFAIAVALTTAGAALLTGTAPAAHAEEDDAGVTPIQRLGACLAGGGQGDVILLMDESLSLQTSDPDGARVDAATYFVDQLGTYAMRSSATIDVQIAGFAQQLDASDWVRLDAPGGAELTSELETFRDRDDQGQTDYWSALDTARSLLDARGAPCQAIVWFSDGDLDYTYPAGTRPEGAADPRPFAPGVEVTNANADEIRDAAAQDLCRPGGVADSLRSSDIIVLGIGLDGQEAGVDFSLMQRIATGDDGCGEIVDPEPGTFIPASDLDELLFAFDELSTPDQPPLRSPTGPHRVVLDRSTSHATLLVGADSDGASMTLRAPTGESASIPTGGAGAEGTLSFTGAAVTYAWESERSVTLTIDRTAADVADGWSGLWQVDVQDASGAQTSSRAHVRVVSDLLPEWTNAVLEADRGTTLDVELALVQRPDAPFEPTLDGSIAYEATYTDAAGREMLIFETGDPAAITTQSLDLGDVPIGTSTVTVQSTITTAPTTFEGEQVLGTPLLTDTVTYTLAVLTPPNYPDLPDAVDFGSIEADEVVLEGAMTIAGQGCVTLTGDVTVDTSPSEIGDVVRIAADGDCLPAGDVPLTLTTDASGNGPIRGSFTVTLTPDDGSDPIDAEVPFTADVSRPLDVGTASLWFVLAILLALGIPLLLLYVLKHATSTIPNAMLYGFTVDVRVDDAGVTRDGAPFTIRTEDASHLVSVRRRARSVQVEDVALRVRTGLSPFGRGRVVVHAPGATSISSATPSADRSGTRAVLPLAIHNEFVLLRTPGMPADAARLLVLLGGLDETATSRFVRKVEDRAPGRLVELVATEPSTPGTGPFDGAASTASTTPWEANPFAASVGTAPTSTAADAPSRPTTELWGDNPWSTPPSDDGDRR